MPKLARPLAVFLVTATVTALALGLLPGPGGGSLQDARANVESRSDHDLAALRLFNRVVLLVRDHYVDPDKFHPKEMLLSSLDWVEKRIAEVLVDERTALENGKVTITVGAKTQTFDISKVETLWDMSFRLKDILAFVEQNLVSTEDTRDIEYAAINGMLATLDPHSNLLDPEAYADMKMHTRGEFGGLGFVVSMRESRLTVMKILPNTPAHRGGIKARDVITRIEDESTINMDLTEAVKRLRGKPGAPVSFWVDRKGFESPRRFTINRDVIAIESIDPVKLLSGNVGYIRITNFQGNTTSDLRRAVTSLSEQAKGKLSGLVLDLRGNPGGLLDQAISVSDLFVKDGTIVSTVGAGKKLRERRDASVGGTIADLPLVVLVSNNSASASEIVAGAMKNLDRGVLVGAQTFGKGSVQVLYDLFDESALKLTIAEYLTSGDLSIQQIGVTPDISLEPALVSKKRIMVFAPRLAMREAELEEHMASEVLGAAPGSLNDPKRPGREAPDKPVASLTFLRDDVPEDEEIDEFEEPEWEEDFHVRFARELLVKAGAPTRSAILQKAKAVMDARRQAEQTRIDAALAGLGVDWRSSGKPNGTPKVSAQLSTRGPARAGETVDLVLTVKNEGTEPLDRVRAWTKSRDARHVPYGRILDSLEFVLGHLAAGESRSWTVPVELPADMPARIALLDLNVEAAGQRAKTLPVTVAIDELPRPRFAFTWAVDDSEHGNGDGMLSPGEEVQLLLTVENVGEGQALETIATIKNLENEKVYISKGRHHVGALAPGHGADASMTVDLKEGYDGSLVRLRALIFDQKLAEATANELQLPVVHKKLASQVKSGAVKATAGVAVRAWADAGAPELARLDKGATVPVTHEVGAFTRVKLGESRFGFVPTASVKAAKAAPKRVTGVGALILDRPPVIALKGLSGSVATDADELRISGVVTDESGLRDMYVFLNNQKVYFQAHAGGETARMPFDTTMPLEEGLNTVVVFARENDDLLSRRTLMVYRRPAALAHAQEAGAGPVPENRGAAKR